MGDVNATLTFALHLILEELTHSELLEAGPLARVDLETPAKEVHEVARVPVPVEQPFEGDRTLFFFSSLLLFLHQCDHCFLAVQDAAGVLQLLLVRAHLLQDHPEPLVQLLRLRVELQCPDRAAQDQQPQFPNVVCLFQVERLLANRVLDPLNGSLGPQARGFDWVVQSTTLTNYPCTSGPSVSPAAAH